jgi:hypothetical protein
MIAYYAWDLPESGSIHFSEGSKPPEVGASLLYIVKAESWEEAMAIHHLRQGFEPYVPQGKPETCSCGAVYYPEGSGQCWKCRKVR